MSLSQRSGPAHRLVRGRTTNCPSRAVGDIGRWARLPVPGNWD